MADATFSDVLQETRKTNEILRQTAKDADKPNPKKFIIEEIVQLRQASVFHREEIQLDKKRNKEQDQQTDIAEKRGKGDSKYYKKQLTEQSHTTEDLDILVDEEDQRGMKSRNLLAEQLAVEQFQADLIKGLLLFQLGNERAARNRATRAQAEAKLEEVKEMGRFESLFLQIKNAFSLKNIGRALALPLKGIFKAAGFIGKGAKGIFGKLKNIFTGKTMLALVAGLALFFGGKYIKQIDNWIRTEGLPMLAYFIDETLPAIGGFFKEIYTSVKKYFTDNPEFQKAYKLIKKGEFFKAIEMGLLGVINDITEYFGGKRQDSLSKAVAIPLMNAYNAIAESLNRMIEYLPGVPYLPKIRDGKFVSGDPAVIEAEKKQKAKEKQQEIYGTRRSGRGRPLEATPEQRENRRLREIVRGGVFDRLPGRRLSPKLENAIVEVIRGKTGPSDQFGSTTTIERLRDAVRERAATEKKLNALEEKRQSLLKDQASGIDSFMQPTGRGTRKKIDVSEEISKLEKSIAQLATEALKSNNIITNLAPNTALSSNTTYFGGGGGTLNPQNSNINMVTDAAAM